MGGWPREQWPIWLEWGEEPVFLPPRLINRESIPEDNSPGCQRLARVRFSGQLPCRCLIEQPGEPAIHRSHGGGLGTGWGRACLR